MVKSTRGWSAWILGFTPALSVLGQDPPETDQGEAKPRAGDAIGLPADYVRYSRLPAGGIQPLAFTDPADPTQGLTLLYFVPRDEEQGDLFTCRSSDEGKTFSDPLRVNAVDGSVASPDGFHRACGALANGGVLHVLWIDLPAGTGSDGERGPGRLVYARVAADGNVEAGREVFGALDGPEAGALAVDEEGRVFAFFSAREELEDGAVRYRIWAARSTDGGDSFSEPVAVDREEQGVSVGSALAAGVSPKGAIYVLYRMNASFGKAENPDAGVKDTRLLSSVDAGETYKSVFVDNWKLGRDPKSGACLFRAPGHMFVAYEGRGQVYWSYIKNDVHKIGLPIEPKRKSPELWRNRPVVAANRGREVMLAYLERPRAAVNAQSPAPDAEPVLAWQVWDKSRNFPLDHGFGPEPPRKSWPAAIVRADGGFTLFY
jgi:hypothetical protein